MYALVCGCESEVSSDDGEDWPAYNARYQSLIPEAVGTAGRGDMLQKPGQHHSTP